MRNADARPVRFGLIGAGRIAQVAHLPAIDKARNADLVAVCDPSALLARGVAEPRGIDSYTSVPDLLQADLDAVIIATPDRTHFQLASLALRAGRHVLIEKPLTDNLTDAERLAHLAAETGHKVQVGAMKRHDPGIQFAKSSLPSIGPVVSMQAWYRVMSSLRPATEATLFPATIVDDGVRKTEAGYKSDRGRYLLATHGAHVFDALRYLAGDLSNVRAQQAHVGPDYSWHGTAKLAETGGLASFEISANVHANWAEGFEIYGEKGHIRVQSYFPFFRRPSSVAVFTEDDCITRSPSFGDTDPYKRQLEAFSTAILDDAPTNPDALDGVAAVRFVSAVQRSSAANGKRVEL